MQSCLRIVLLWLLGVIMYDVRVLLGVQVMVLFVFLCGLQLCIFEYSFMFSGFLVEMVLFLLGCLYIGFVVVVGLLFGVVMGCLVVDVLVDFEFRVVYLVSVVVSRVVKSVVVMMIKWFGMNECQWGLLLDVRDG